MPEREHTRPYDPQGNSLPHQVVNRLFAASLDVHQALQVIGYDNEPAWHLHSVLARLDDTVTTILHNGLVCPVGERGLERLVIDAFVALANGLAGGFDLGDYLSTLARCGDQPDTQAAAFVLGETDSLPILVVAAPDQAPLRELCQLRPSPGWDTCHSGQPQTVTDLTTDIRWPLFAARAHAAGYQAAHTMPLRRRGTLLGALTLLSTTPGALSADSDRIAHVLADLATIGILLHQPRAHRELDAELRAGTTRIHQAEGILAERHHITVIDATTAMATHARRNGQRLPDLARAIIKGTADLSDSITGPAYDNPPTRPMP